jgi:predicted ATPase
VIDQVRFVDFRVLRDVTIDFEPFTVLVGPNGSGKTTVLRALHERRNAPATAPESEFHIRGSSNGKMTYALKDKRGQWTSGGGVKSEHRLWREVIDADATTALLQVDGRSLRTTSYHQTPGQRIESTGVGLAAMLADLLLTRRKSAEKLTTLLRSIVPGVLEVQAVRDPQNTSSPAYRVAMEFEPGGVIDADHISEGTLMALALLLTIVDAPPDVLLIDDLDKGLHPGAQVEMVSILRDVLASHPGTQIVATTHSPYLVDCFDPSEVRVMSLGDDGYALCRKLTDHPHFADWEGALEAGEMWASVGEAWIREASAS